MMFGERATAKGATARNCPYNISFNVGAILSRLKFLRAKTLASNMVAPLESF